MSSVQVRNVSKSYAQSDVIRNVSVEIPDDEFVGGGISYDIWPKHIRPSDIGVAGSVHLLEPKGATTEIVAAVGPHRLVALAHERHAVRSGQQVMLAINTNKVRLFSEDGRRIAWRAH